MTATSMIVAGGVLQVLLLAALSLKLPDWTRPELMFAVTVPVEFRETAEAASVTSAYRRRVLLVSAATLVVVLGSGLAGWPAVAIGAPIVQVVGLILAFLAARTRVLPHARAPTGA